ncbi:phosphatase PAP2 family protein [Paenibacillus oralis]|uniref:Phosphatase PAP2 family protein n=1 Tax=Paenibacillus oralis TaxID=2490856 RepID=A0A3P3UAA6_9BACL|nr:phosphatase PAP2 family protein [Paenibacillus oralis]RRJ67285.1 phosphatase PAP2 family protein [Paenibacillus oralis]
MRYGIWAALLAVCFVLLGYMVQHDMLVLIDQAIGDFFFALRTDGLNPIIKAFSNLGTTSGFVVAFVIVLAWTLIVLRRGQYAIWLTVSLAGAWLLNKLLKSAYHRERPELWDSLAVPDGYSFPSGNAMISAAFYGFIAILLLRSGRNGNKAWGVIIILVILLIGISRLYLGVHYASDIAGGLLAGASVALLCSFGTALRWETTNKIVNHR